MADGMDPVTALTYALSCPTDSPEQATALKGLKAVFEAQPSAIPQFCATLLGNAVAGKDSLFKRFTIELFGFALGTMGLSLDVRTQREFRCRGSQSVRNTPLRVFNIRSCVLIFSLLYGPILYSNHPCIRTLTYAIYFLS